MILKIKFGEAPDNGNEDYPYVDNRLDFGIQAGIGVLVADKVLIDLRYGLGISSLYDTEDDDSKSQNRVIQLTVGIPLSFGK